MGKREVSHRQAVYQAMIGRFLQRLHRAAHGEMGRTKNVEAVDLLMIRKRHCPDDVRVSGDYFKKIVPFRGADFFGIVKAATRKTAGQNDCCRGYWSGQWAPTRLINTRDPMDSA